jgi:hypothetical protein
MTPIHLHIKNGDYTSVETSLQSVTWNRRIYRVFIFWNPLQFAKLHLNIAKCFYPERVSTAQKIYNLVRDYSLFVAISDSNLLLVETILRHHSKNLDLGRKLEGVGYLNTCFCKTKAQRDQGSYKASALYSRLADFAFLKKWPSY